MPDPIVDIVLATNRDSAYLEAALVGIRAQTYEAWRLIVVDDGVADRAALRRAISAMPHTLLIESGGAGVSHARNVGIGAGSGDFIAFHDDDDVWKPDKLEKQVGALLKDSDAIGCHTGGYFVDAIGAPFGTPWPAASTSSREFLSGAAVLPRFVTLMVRRRVLAECGLFDPSYRLGEDLEFMTRLVQFGELAAVDEQLIAYRRHGSNASATGDLEGRRSSRRLILEHLANASSDDLRSLLEANLASKEGAWAAETAAGLVQAVRNRDPRAFADEVRFAASTGPSHTLYALMVKIRGVLGLGRAHQQRNITVIPESLHSRQPEFTYVVTSYREPTQILRLVERLRSMSPRSSIIVSHDLKSQPLDEAAFAMHGARVVRTPSAINWGDKTYLRSILDLFGSLDIADTSWVTLLSAQDYPLRHLRDFEAHLRDGGGDAHLEPAGAATNDAELLRRYFVKSHRLPLWVASKGRYLRMANLIPGLTAHLQPHGLPPTLEVRRLRTPFGPHLIPYRGADLYAVNGRAIRVLVHAPQSLTEYFDRTPIPSEGFPHTVLRNDPSVVVVDEILHLMQWNASAHPEWLDSGHADLLATTPHWFARKFHADDPVLDILDLRLDRQEEAADRE